MNRPTSLTLTLAAGAAALCAWPTPSLGLARMETEEQRVARVMQAALEKHGGDVNRCFERALADTMDVAGKVELAMDVGQGGHVTRAVALEHTAGSPVLLACLQDSATGWVIPELAAGTTVILPLSFEGQMAQFSIKAADAPEHGPGVGDAGKGKKPKHASKVAPPFKVKVLIDEATMHASQASMSILTLSPASRIAMHRHPGAEVLYIKKGRARVLGPSGVKPEVLPEGTAVYIPAGMPHVIENMVRSADAEMFQIFAPLGPERVYRDPHDETGRAAFEVIRDTRRIKAPPGTRFTVDSFDKAKVYKTAGGKVHVHLLFDPETTDSKAASLSVVEFDAGTQLPRHSHADSAELLYIMSGGGELMIGSEKLPFGADQAIHLPANQPHSAKFKEKTVALQIYAPAGPEQRYKGGDAPAGKPGKPGKPDKD